MKNILFLLLILLFPSSTHAALVGWYKLNESSGNAIDSSPSGITGTANGTTVVAGGCRRDNCRSFNGTTDGIDLGDNFDFVGSSYTACAWTRPLGSGNSGYVWGKFEGQQAYMRRFSDTDISFGNVAGQIIGPATITVGQWSHICVVYVHNGTSILYHNGVASGASGVLTAHTDNARSMFIGNRWDGARAYQGEIDDVRFYDTPLSEAEIMAIYRQAFYSGEVVIGKNSVIANSIISY